MSDMLIEIVVSDPNVLGLFYPKNLWKNSSVSQMLAIRWSQNWTEGTSIDNTVALGHQTLDQPISANLVLFMLKNLTWAFRQHTAILWVPIM